MSWPIWSIWNNFKIKVICGKTDAICKYCELVYLTPNATKMSEHYEKAIMWPIKSEPD